MAFSTRSRRARNAAADGSRLLSLPRQAQCFEGDIQPQLVPEFEAVHDGARGAVDLEGHATNAMRFQPLREGLRVEAIYGDGY